MRSAIPSRSGIPASTLTSIQTCSASVVQHANAELILSLLSQTFVLTDIDGLAHCIHTYKHKIVGILE